MKNVLIKDTFRRIWRTKGRFFAIMAIIAIGCGFFAGIKVTSPDMKKTADLYYKEYNLMDIKLLSEIGFSDKEIEKLAKDSNVKNISGEYSADVFIETADGNSPVTKVQSMDIHSDNIINAPKLEEGRLPQAENECLIERNTPSEYKVGDKITLSTKDEENPIGDILTTETFTIVGKVSWVKYTDFQRGTTTIGNGSIKSYLIVPREAFKYDYYTEVYLTLNNTENVNSFSDEYVDIIDSEKDRFEQMAEEIHKDRISETQKDFEDAEKELADGKKEYEDNLAEFNTKIADAEKQISDAQKQIAEQEKQFNTVKKQFDDSLSQYNSGMSEITSKLEDLETQQSQLDEKTKELNSSKELFTAFRDFIQSGFTTVVPVDNNSDTLNLIKQLRTLDTDELSVSNTAYAYAGTQPDTEQKVLYYNELVTALEGLDKEIKTAEVQISTAQAQITQGRSQLNEAQTQLNQSYPAIIKGQEQIDDAEKKLTDAKTQVEENEQKLSDEKADGKKKLDDAKKEIDENTKKLADSKKSFEKFVKNPKLYVFDRNSDTGYSSFGDDADRVDSVAKIFPIFFILVAGLVCLTTMTRMVEEQRTEIGTLKALGYGNTAIASQFLLYSVSASVIGAFGGLLIGFNLFPKVIFNAYRMMYIYPDVVCKFRWDYTTGCLVASLLCTGLSSMVACYSELSGRPAQLMRPKPPKNGKRVFLEKIPFIWNHMGFNAKVTARNVFRYKNRVLMTVVGIGGCTALMLAGFGLKNAISVIVDLQFEEIIKYDSTNIFSCETDEEYKQLREDIKDNENISQYLFALQKTVTIQGEKRNMEVYAIVPENIEDMGNFIELRDRKTHEQYILNDDGVIINEKLAKLLDLKVGDNVSFDGGEKELKISAITENYVNNYVYFSPATYKDTFGDYDNNTIFADIAEGVTDDDFSKSILENKSVMSVSFMNIAGNTFKDLIKSLNAIVFVIIGSSGALAFVVLYNLSNININERIRELATIKVLGFFDGEVAAYIYRENVISSVLGMIVGLVGGIFFTDFIIQTSEVDVVMFCHDIPLKCYLYAGVLTLVFTALVNAILYFKLKKIDMATSMKAIE